MVEPKSPPPVHLARRYGTKLTGIFFQQDAVSRTSALLQSNARENLKLLAKTNAGTSIARNAQAQLASLPRLPKPVLIGQRTYSTVVKGATISGTRVDVIARGGIENDSTVFTRVYYYVYDPKNGSLLMSGDSVAPDSLATRYGFTPNNLQVTSEASH
jgi:hypothetical protein